MFRANHIPLIRGITSVLMLVFATVNGNPLDNEEVNANDIHPAVVDTTYGPVKGIYLPEGVQAYLGVPYARPPVKELRWNPPEAPISWGPGILEAFQVSPGYPYICEDTPEVFCPQQVDEDCLYLNIWTPRGAKPTSNLPVVIFIHGGAMYKWSASAPGFDGRFVAEMSDVIFVNFNYRIGALGWLKTEGEEGLSGNYGLMDQRAAIKFVQENIRNFGGNPKKVTLNGHSAGALSTTIHMTNPATDEFFHQVILQSNPLAVPLASITEAVKLSTRFATYLNCTPTDTVCLRSRGVEDIIWAQGKSREIPINYWNPLLWFEQFGPVIDGVEITQHLIEELAQGKIRVRPLISGFTSSEAASDIHGLFLDPPFQVDILSELADYFGRYTYQVLNKNWEYWNLDIRRLLIELSSDYMFVCPTRYVTQTFESFKDTPIYSYVINHTFSDNSVWTFDPDGICSVQGFTCHDTDLFFTLSSLTLSGYTYTTSERKLAHEMMTYWANFFHTGDPNNSKWRKASNDVTSVYGENYDQDNRIFWPRYSKNYGWPSLYFQTPSNKYIHDFKGDECDLLDKVGYTGQVGP